MEVYDDEPGFATTPSGKRQPLGLEHRAEVNDEGTAGRRFTMRRGDGCSRQGGGNEEKEG
jgi:hypothetical protein